MHTTASGSSGAAAGAIRDIGRRVRCQLAPTWRVYTGTRPYSSFSPGMRSLGGGASGAASRPQLM